MLGITNYYPVLYNKVKYIAPLYVQNSCPEFGASLRGLKVDYLIMDEIMEGILLHWCGEAYLQSLERFLSQEAELVRTINIEGGYPNFNARGHYLREIKIYRLKT